MIIYITAMISPPAYDPTKKPVFHTYHYARSATLLSISILPLSKNLITELPHYLENISNSSILGTFLSSI